MNIEAVIFDRDGVLTFFDLGAAASYFKPLVPLSVHELGQVWARFGRTHDHPRSLAEEEQFWPRFWDFLGDELHLSADIREQVARFDYTNVVRAFPDARPAMELARRHGLKIGVLSNFTLASLDRSLSAARLLDLVDVACATHVFGVAKPAPEPYLHIARELGVDPRRCLMLDNEPSCVEGARAVGMRAVLVQRTRPGQQPTSGAVQDLSALQRIVQD